MSEAARRAPPPPHCDLWILARRQTAGRGTRGRSWTLPEGNLATTYLTRRTRPPQEAALTSFEAALALGDTLANYTDQIALKWPNDVLVRGCKIAGILLESASGGAGEPWLSIGFGVNIAAVPPAAALRAGGLTPICLADLDARSIRDPEAAPGVEEVLTLLASNLRRYRRIYAEEGFEPIRSAWSARAHGLDRRVEVTTGEVVQRGLFRGLGEDGCLVLETARGPVRIASGDVRYEED